MGPNDQYPYYYGADTTNQSTQNNYGGYQQSRTNQYNQHTRQTSSSNTAQNYNYNQTSYGTDQTQQYNNQNYYANSRADGGQRAAETLSRMGSAATNPSSTATAYNQAQNSYGSNYNSAGSGYSSSTLQNQTTTYPTQTSYATAHTQQARPASVNSTRQAANTATRSPVVAPVQQPRANVSAQYTRAQHMDTVQRSASPAQIQASHQLQRMADQRNQEATQSVPQTQTFVDPSAVYDPWPEYQRKLAAARAAKEEEDKRAAEREAEEKKREEERQAAEDAEKERQKEEEKLRKKEEAAKRRAEKKANADPNAPKKKRKSKGAAAEEAGGASVGGLNLAQLTAMAGAAPAGSDAEGQIRQLMAMVKQMNDKHPDLLAKIWEEERQQHLEKSSETPAPAAEGASGTPGKKKKNKTPKKEAPAAESSAAAATPNTGGKPQLKTSAKSKAAPTPAAALSSATPTSAQPKTAQKANNSARGTIWPPEKKGQIAAAAVRWLGTLPGNHGRPPVTQSQIASMLDKNPTYIELCEMIEPLGFKVERAAFAKALLTSVPDVNANRSAASPAVPRPPSTGPLRTPNAASATAAAASGNQGFARPPMPATTSPSTSRLPDMQFPAYTSPYFDAQGDEIPTKKPSETKAKGKKKAKKAEKDGDAMDVDSDRPSETPGPVTKAEAARKRTFADLVDLTALSDEDEAPPFKQQYFGPPAITRPGEAYSSKLDFLPTFDGASVIDPHLQRSVDKFGPPTQQFNRPAYGQPQQPAPSFERQQMQTLANKLNNYELAKQIDKKNALRRSRYDVRTLARDVLLATGKHPDLLPLNGHLENLRSMYPNTINFNTDLATVRWEILDPGEPVPEALAHVVNDDKDSVIDDADDESEEDVRHFAVRAPSRTQSIAIGASGSPGMQLASPTVDGFGFGRGKLIPSRGRGRPRGRPPGFARFSTGGAQTPIGNHRPAGSGESPAPGRTPGSGPSYSGPGYSSFARDARPDGTKRRGRPVGWRKHLHQRGVGVEAGGEGYVYADQKREVAKNANASPLPATEPKFPVFKCKWEGCGAELHNLQTLRKHVNKKHGVPDKVSGKITCKWEGCGRMVQTIGGDGGVGQSMQHFDYPEVEMLMRHVEGKHVGPMGWELGDGPVGGFSDSNASDAESYLKDREGRQVTPTIPAAPGPSGSAANSSAQRTPGTGRGRPPKKTDEEKARESQAELARRKREIGLGVDREGATLANEKRRQGFVDDEDGMEVTVEASD